ncbi:biotin-dependent carboxyltransferase family protein [Rahnella sp. SAP-1]|uniref:Biotin-dependent carboxyltransferase family protein n=1 Tax=Rouxiella aceris TaxID=2703884 RepID=A0A848MQA3_9GAMM|nr:biotin-dependent carboxyltransferase family protein [Rouxiella aceris]NMP29249.1 biotin-dependent carboxyltransferase family protein [Rouxiella aceris]
MIEIEKTTALSSIQDLGRSGCLNYGVGRAGAMDPLALQLGNLLLANDPQAAAIEIPLFPFRVRFLRDCAFAVSGNDGDILLDDKRLPPWWVAQAKAGQSLTINASRHSARAYLHLPGGIDVPQVLGSRSTQLRGAFGGYQGRGLQKGDRLAAKEPDRVLPSDIGIASPWLRFADISAEVQTLRVLPAAEHLAYTAASREKFWQQTWKITPQSNRYGYRLEGEALVALETMEMRSHGIVPGVIQVPHNGQPIIQMSDAQPSGGYPKFATVIEADLWLLGQIPPGRRIRFVACNYDQAREAWETQQAYLQQVAQQLRQLRGTAYSVMS